MHDDASIQCHDHAHGHAHGNDSRGRLLATIGVTCIIMLAEAVGGYIYNSLALLADAGHMLTDFLSLVLALAAVTLGARPADDRRTYGYRRLEVLAALMNSVALVVVSGSILWEAWQRFWHPGQVQVQGMLLVASVGLAANLLALWLLGHGHQNVNIRGAFLHILADTLSSAGVIVGGVVIYYTGWTRIDPILSVLISLVVVVGSYRLLREVIDVLLEAVPSHIDAEKVRRSMGQVPGVVDVHDLHIWSITTGLTALSAHVVVSDPECDTHVVLTKMLAHLAKTYAIEHATLQIERSQHDACGCQHS